MDRLSVGVRIGLSALFACLLLSAPAHAETTIETFSSWNGAKVTNFGQDWTKNYGQTITVPLMATALESFSFEMKLPATVIFRGVVYAWDGSKATGPQLYVGDPRSTTAGSGSFERITFTMPGDGIAVNPGDRYVLFATATMDAGSGWGPWAGFKEQAYSDGSWVCTNYPQQGAWGTWTTKDWNVNVDYPDLAFEAVFASPPSAPIATEETFSILTGFSANWNASSGANGYKLDVSTKSDFSSYVTNYEDKDVGNVTTSSVTGLSAGTTYYYRVRAYNDAGTSGNSNTITATTRATSTQTEAAGPWNSGSTWSGGLVPVSGQSVTIANNVTVDTTAEINGLTISTDKTLTFNNGQTLTVNGALNASAGTITFSGTGTLNLTGTVECDAFGTFNCGTGTVVYSADADQNVDNLTYYNLTLGGTGTWTKTPCGTTTVENALTTAANTTLAPGAHTLNIGSGNDGTGSWTNNGTFSKGTGTVNYAETGDQTILALDYSGLGVAGTGTKTFSGTTTATGGITVSGSVTVTGDGSATTFVQAHATDAASATNRVFKVESGNTVTISNMTVRNGNATAGIGGGIYNEGALTVNNTTISDNTTIGYGGGICNDSGGDITIEKCTISNNSAGSNGGGISSNDDINIYNSTISGNTANGAGGGIVKYGADKTVTIRNCTIANNHSDNDNTGSGDIHGGGIYLGDGTLDFRNTIIANNYEGSGTATGDDYHYASGTLTDNGYNVVEYQGFAGSWSRTDAFDADTSILYNYDYQGNPSTSWTQGGVAVSGSLGLSDTLADNGGPTLTLALSSGSFADGAIPYSAGSNTFNNCPDLDQRSYYRAFTGSRDIGAYEYGGAAPANGDYISTTIGDWSAVGTWDTYNAATKIWGDPSVEPTSSNNVVVAANHTVTVDGTDTVNGQTVSQGGTVTLGVNSLTASGAADINGTLSISTGTFDANGSFDATGGSVTFTGAGNLRLGGATVTSVGTLSSDNGTVWYDRAGDQTVLADSYYSFQTGGSGAKTLGGALNVDGNLTIGSGTTLSTSGSNHAMNIAGNWSNSGDFTAGIGTVVLDGTGTSEITGSTSFYNFTCFTAGKTLTFDSASDKTQTVTGTFTLAGEDGNRIIVNSTSSGDQADINVGASSVNYVNVKDSNNTGTAIVANNSVNSLNNGGWSFGVPPTVSTNAASALGPIGATLNGTVNANDFSTTVTFEYGTTTGYGSTATAEQSPVTGSTDTAVSKALTGLSSGTEYHYRVRGVSDGGTVYGSDQTFSTYAASVTSAAGGGNWSDTSTWVGLQVPVSGQNVTIAGDVTLDTNREIRGLTVNSGKTLAMSEDNSLTVNGTLSASGSTVTFTGSGTLDLAGTVECDAFGTFNCGTGTVIYSADADQNVDNLTYYNLTLGGTGTWTKTPCGETTVENALTTAANTTLAPGAHTLNIGSGNDGTGSWTNNGTFSKGTGTVNYAETGDQTILALDYSGLGVAGSGTKTFSGTTTATGGITVSGSVTVTGDGSATTFVQAHANDAASATNRVFKVESGNTVTISNMTVRNGNATAGNGGGIYNEGALTVNNATISDNTAIGYGGGIDNRPGGDITIEKCTISNNSAASDGGGIYSSDNTRIYNSTISHNKANHWGGGIRQFTAGELIIENSTIANNHADFDGSAYGGGGGYFAEIGVGVGDAHIRNTIIANNIRGDISSTTGDDYCYYIGNGGGELIDNGYNVVEYQTFITPAVWSTTTAFDASTSILYNYDYQGNPSTSWTQGGVAVSGSLGLSDTLADNGGPTQTLALAVNSFAMDAIPYADVGSGVWNGARTTGGNYLDQRGAETTPSNPICIGAYEVYADYRTRAGGATSTWSGDKTWQVDNGMGYENTSTLPTADNSLTIAVNRDVSVNVDVTIDQTTVAADKTLTVNTTQTLTVANGDGTDLTADGNLAINAVGTLRINSGASVDSNGAFASSGTVSFGDDDDGTLSLAAAGPTFGTLTPGNGTVTYDGTDQAITESLSFYNLTKNVSSDATLTFPSGIKTTITNTLDLQGQSQNLLSLRSSSSGTQCEIDPKGTRTIQYLDVKDSNNVSGTDINAAGTNSANSGNNTGWTFDQPPSPPPPPVTTPKVTTAAVSSITDTTAVSGGNVTSDGGKTVTSRGVCWSTSANPTLADRSTSEGTGTGAFTSSITGLTSGTTYHIRAYAGNSVGTAYGSDVVFTTGSTTVKVTTAAVSSITDTTAVSGGNVTSGGGKTVTSRGVCWSTSANPTLADSHTSDGTGTGVFTSSITGLTSGTTYHVRAYAGNSVGTAYGSDVAFATEGVVAAKVDLTGPPSVVTDAVSSAFTVIARDDAGNEAVVTQDTVLSLSSDSSGTTTFYSDSAGTKEITAVTISKGGSSAAFYCKDSEVGEPTITATCVSGMSLGSGTHKLTVKSIVDAPVATLANYPSGLTNETEYSVTVGGIGVVSYRYSVDIDNWSDDMEVTVPLTFNVVTEGPHTLYVIGKDVSGLEQPAEDATTAEWTVDTTPPVATMDNYPQGTIGLTTTDVIVGGEDVKFYKYRVDNGGWSVAVSVETHIRLSDLTEGPHILDVIGVDTPGNWQKEEDATTAEWTIDPSVPTAVLSSLPAGITNKTAVSIIVGGEDVDAYKYSLDDGVIWSYGLIVEPIEHADLAEATYTVYVNAYSTNSDKWQGGLSGETMESATKYTWTIDLTAPVAVTTLSAAVGVPASTVVKLSWLSVENSLKGYDLWYSTAMITEGTLPGATQLFCGMTPSPKGYSETFTIIGLQAGTTYYFGVKSTDAAGNLSGISNIASFTTANTLPVIVGFALPDGGTSGDNSISRELKITGVNFLGSAGDNIVRFISTSATGSVFDVVTKAGSETEMRADVPEGAPVGTYRLMVINKNGTSALIRRDIYRYPGAHARARGD